MQSAAAVAGAGAMATAAGACTAETSMASGTGAVVAAVDVAIRVLAGASDGSIPGVTADPLAAHFSSTSLAIKADASGSAGAAELILSCSACDAT
jgi:hypothetical protein